VLGGERTKDQAYVLYEERQTQEKNTVLETRAHKTNVRATNREKIPCFGAEHAKTDAAGLCDADRRNRRKYRASGPNYAKTDFACGK
jgi:tRNA U34 2-thiouridine synthase MnmA/TrmU